VSSPKHYDAILFDFDGVLADTEPLHWRCWRDILTPFGIDLTWETFQRECIGVNDRDFGRMLAARRVPPLDFDELWAQYPRKKELFRERVVAEQPFLPATLELVHNLQRDYSLAVVSSSARSEIEPALLSAGIRDCFRELVCGKEAANYKPAPDPYLRAAELLESSRPLVVEDSEAGVASAKAAGFDVVRVSTVHDVASAVRRAIGEETEDKTGNGEVL
jgi:HAD superfamily hydrolase (TIGR01509 family)